jgi:hypothetical protein
VAEALGGFGVEGFGSDSAIAPSWSHQSWCRWLAHRAGGSVPVGMGRFETGKVRVVWFSVLFLYFLGLVRDLISITRYSSSFATLTGTSKATLFRPLSTAL